MSTARNARRLAKALKALIAKIAKKRLRYKGTTAVKPSPSKRKWKPGPSTIPHGVIGSSGKMKMPEPTRIMLPSNPPKYENMWRLPSGRIVRSRVDKHGNPLPGKIVKSPRPNPIKGNISGAPKRKPNARVTKKGLKKETFKQELKRKRQTKLVRDRLRAKRARKERSKE